MAAAAGGGAAAAAAAATSRTEHRASRLGWAVLTRGRTLCPHGWSCCDLFLAAFHSIVVHSFAHSLANASNPCFDGPVCLRRRTCPTRGATVSVILTPMCCVTDPQVLTGLTCGENQCLRRRVSADGCSTNEAVKLSARALLASRAPTASACHPSEQAAPWFDLGLPPTVLVCGVTLNLIFLS